MHRLYRLLAGTAALSILFLGASVLPAYAATGLLTRPTDGTADVNGVWGYCNVNSDYALWRTATPTSSPTFYLNCATYKPPSKVTINLQHFHFASDGSGDVGGVSASVLTPTGTGNNFVITAQMTSGTTASCSTSSTDACRALTTENWISSCNITVPGATGNPKAIACNWSGTGTANAAAAITNSASYPAGPVAWYDTPLASGPSPSPSPSPCATTADNSGSPCAGNNDTTFNGTGTTAPTSCGAWWHIGCWIQRALAWAFVPDTATLSAQWDSVQTEISGKYPFGPLIWGVNAVGYTLGAIHDGITDTALSCSYGPNFDIPGAGSYHLNLAACDGDIGGPSSALAGGLGWTRAMSRVMFIILGLLTAWRVFGKLVGGGGDA